MNWALVMGLYLGDVIKSLLLVLGPFFNLFLGLRLRLVYLLFQTPSHIFYIFYILFIIIFKLMGWNNGLRWLSRNLEFYVAKYII